MAKRAFDIFAAALALLLLLPVFLAIALAIRTRLGRPVIFRQTRPGLHGKPFELVKFRTMSNICAPDGRLLSDEERLSPFGRALRASSLDELPELWNVLEGSMSLVGPRPLLLEYLPRYSPEQARRHDVRPGITGWAQVNGRNALTWEEKFALDAWYVSHWSFFLDIKILFMTVWNVITRHGISQDGHATMSKFMGSASGDTHS